MEKLQEEVKDLEKQVGKANKLFGIYNFIWKIQKSSSDFWKIGLIMRSDWPQVQSKYGNGIQTLYRKFMFRFLYFFECFGCQSVSHLRNLEETEEEEDEVDEIEPPPAYLKKGPDSLDDRRGQWSFCAKLQVPEPLCRPKPMGSSIRRRSLCRRSIPSPRRRSGNWLLAHWGEMGEAKSDLFLRLAGDISSFFVHTCCVFLFFLNYKSFGRRTHWPGAERKAVEHFEGFLPLCGHGRQWGDCLDRCHAGRTVDDFTQLVMEPTQEKIVEKGTRLINQGDDGESWNQNLHPGSVVMSGAPSGLPLCRRRRTDELLHPPIWRLWAQSQGDMATCSTFLGKGYNDESMLNDWRLEHGSSQARYPESHCCFTTSEKSMCCAQKSRIPSFKCQKHKLRCLQIFSHIFQGKNLSTWNHRGLWLQECLAGDAFGELALLYNCPRAASVEAAERWWPGWPGEGLAMENHQETRKSMINLW